MKKILIICLVALFNTISCQEQNKEIMGNPKKGLTKEFMPKHIQDLYKVDQGEDPMYIRKADSMYHFYMKQNMKDSALFCLIAWHEVLDQNYIYDSNALSIAKQHYYQGMNTTQNQQELLKLGYYIGSMHYSGLETDSSIRWFYKTMNHPKVLPNTKTICYTMLGITYANINKLDSAIILDQLKIDYYKSANDTVNLAITYANLSQKYKYIYAMELAEQYALDAIQKADLTKDTFTQIMVRHNYIGILVERDTFTKELQKYTHDINHLIKSFSRNNLTLKYAQAQSNMHLYDLRLMFDSMAYWVNIYKEITIKRGGGARKDFLVFEGRYKNYTHQPINNINEYAMAANEYFKDKEYKGAYALYIILLDHAKRNKNYEMAYAYKDTINQINKKLFAATNEGKLYELEIKYKTKLKDQEIEISKQEIKAKTQNNFLLASLLAILTLGFISALLWQERKKIKMNKEKEEKFTQMLMENTEYERRRIAQDLHDSVGHELLNVKNTLHDKMQSTENKIDRILDEVREISRSLFPVMFEEVGLKYSIEQLIDNFQTNSGLYVISEINYSNGKLPSKVELNIYRIIQEAFNNTRKYAKAKSILLKINETVEKVEIEIKDNGVGFDVMEKLKSNSSFGLISMNQRAKSIGTNIAITSSAKGTSIAFEIPLKKYV